MGDGGKIETMSCDYDHFKYSFFILLFLLFISSSLHIFILHILLHDLISLLLFLYHYYVIVQPFDVVFFNVDDGLEMPLFSSHQSQNENLDLRQLDERFRSLHSSLQIY
jgi:hypothetical protein